MCEKDDFLEAAMNCQTGKTLLLSQERQYLEPKLTPSHSKSGIILAF
jgi:hypothetical protein